MNIDLLRNELRNFQQSIYVDEDNVILSSFFLIERNIKLLEIITKEIKSMLMELKDEIFQENINKSNLFNYTVKLDILLEDFSIEYHKK